MRDFPKIEFEELWIPALLCLIVALPLTVVLWFNGFGFINCFLFGIVTGIFVGLSFLSIKYKFLRIICAIILAAAAMLLSMHAQFSTPLTILVVSLGAILGYFARKWIEIIWYAS